MHKCFVVLESKWKEGSQQINSWNILLWHFSFLFRNMLSSPLLWSRTFLTKSVKLSKLKEKVSTLFFSFPGDLRTSLVSLDNSFSSTCLEMWLSSHEQCFQQSQKSSLVPLLPANWVQPGGCLGNNEGRQSVRRESIHWCHQRHLKASKLWREVHTTERKKIHVLSLSLHQSRDNYDS